MVLVGYWPLNESSGSTAYDHSGNENHGAINDGGDSTVPGATGILGQNAYSFDGSNDYVDTGNKFDQFSEISVSVWVLHDSLGTLDDIRSFVANHDDNTGIFMQTDGSGGIRIGVGDGSNWNYVDSGEKGSNTWYHCVLAYDGSEVKAYIDGVKYGSTSTGYSTSSVSNVRIGRGGPWGSGSQYWPGKISEVRIYNHALTPQEVQYLYQVGKRGRQVTSSRSS
jgi:hypothetical protein